ncbi:ROK family transcriptional regulator [Chelonobacter oris]|uniref:ROK family transcriptional regulator n=1 Tax=Chelonobacter oris TaxID=505317 RepID=A0A0A3B978_9PAST|nr:ROK family transcriptional regulator [Chelonobacter oris]KGQ70124.1 ROK family transcriptional regulator [Chelonobacter oris]
MSKISVPLNIKKENYHKIYHLFFEHDKLSKPEVAQLLNLSLPTVVNNISELEAEGKIRNQGFNKSQGGRPATAYQLIDDAFIALGVEIQRKKIKLVALNLKGKVISLKETPLACRNDEAYLGKLCRFITQFMAELGYQSAQILGIGISIQAITSKDGSAVLYGKITPCEQFHTDKLQPHLPYPIKLYHDVKCAAKAELWEVKHIDNAIYVSISEHLGGAMILNNQIDLGKNGYSGALEHLQLSRDGKACYCGQIGCMETHCSLEALLQSKDEIADFFTRLRIQENMIKSAVDNEIVVRWQAFLDKLAQGLNYVYLLLERDIILGGEISAYLNSNDLILLQNKIKTLSSFPLEGDFIRIATVQKNASAIGAALPFVSRYLYGEE